MVNLFLVKSPLQLLNAIEASFFFNTENTILILRYTSNYRTNLQLNNLLKIKEWGKIYFVRYSNWPINFLKEFQILKSFKISGLKIHDIFIGDYRLLNFKIFSSNLQHNKTYLIDDGTGTFTVQDFYLKKQKEYKEKFLLGFLKKTIAIIFFQFKTRMNKNIHLFTCYNIQPYPGQEVKKNDYLFTKSYLQRKKLIKINPQKTYYIGAKYVESKLMNEDNYVQLIEKVRRYFKEKEFIYVPHRGEKESKLNKIKSLGIDIEYFDNIVEVEFLFREEIPQIICGFTSSALVNIPKIYPQIKVFIFKVDAQLFVPHYRIILKNIYNRFIKSEGLIVHDI